MDSVYKKQLEKFGIESTRIVEGKKEQIRHDDSIQSTQNVIITLMDTIQGRQWIYQKLLSFGIFETPFVAGKTDVSAFMCGLQHAGHLLRAEVEVLCPNEFYLMMQEASSRVQNISNKD